MKKILLLLLLFSTLCDFSSAQKSTANNTALSAGAALLFSGVKSKLSVAEQNFIYMSINFRLSKDRKSFTDGENEEQSFSAQALPTDMNKDGVEEVFISFGNTYTSGMTGSSIVLYIKKAGGAYEANLGFPGTVPDALPTSNKGYPDLLIGGPGFEFPVWRWNGVRYDFLKKMKEETRTKLKATSIEELSQAYQKTIK